MADLSDIETMFLSAIAGVLFQLPITTSTGASIETEIGGYQFASTAGAGYTEGTVGTVTATGQQARVLRGWPQSTRIEKDCTAGIAQVTVYAVPNQTRNTTRYLLQTTTPIPATSTLLPVISNGMLIVNGAAAAGQVCAVLLGVPGSQSARAYAYRVLPLDTPATIATALAALIPGASASGVTVMLPAGPALVRMGMDTNIGTSYRLQDQRFRVVVWAPNRPGRDTLCGLIDSGLAPLTRIKLVDGWTVYQRGCGTMENDVPGRVSIWRRDLLYDVEYPTVVNAPAPEFLIGGFTIDGSPQFLS